MDRKNLGPLKRGRPRKWLFTNAELQLPVEELAKIKGLPLKDLIPYLKKYSKINMTTSESKLQQTRNIDWTSVDWSKGDTELEKELQVSRTTVAKYRRQYSPRAPQTEREKQLWNLMDQETKRLKEAITQFERAAQRIRSIR